MTIPTQDPTAEHLRDQVRARYAAAATAVTDRQELALTVEQPACGCQPQDQAQDQGQPSGCCGPTTATRPDQADAAGDFGAHLYTDTDRHTLPEAAVLASLGCGNPTAVAELRESETVLDLGAGGGIDVLLSARRVGPTGHVYGLDMTEEMLALARRNQTQAGVTNVTWLKGHIEQIPLPAGSVDVVISNCVVNLSVDKPAVIGEIARVLTPGGRIGITDVVADDHLTSADRAQRGSYVGCIAGALTKGEYEHLLADAGLTQISVTFTHQVADSMHSAIIQAVKPTS